MGSGFEAAALAAQVIQVVMSNRHLHEEPDFECVICWQTQDMIAGVTGNICLCKSTSSL